MTTELLLPQTLQTRESFPAVQESDSFLGRVQVVDEAGFAYLTGDIDFGATGKLEIFQNVKHIVLTEYFSVPLDREFGMDYSMVDRPIPVAEAIFAQEVAMKIAMYEPRVQFQEITYERDFMEGRLSPTVRILLLTTEELPPSLPSTTTTPAAAPGVTIEEIDLPGFYASLVSLAKLPGPKGPAGPQGEQGPQGESSFWYTGTGNPAVDLGEPGDMYLEDDGDIWTYDEAGWLVTQTNIKGPIGPQGPQGIQGDTGAQGSQGLPGPPGASHSTLVNGFTVPPVGQTVVVNLVDASWAVVGEVVYVENANGSGQAGPLQITAKAGNQLTLLNPAVGSTGDVFGPSAVVNNQVALFDGTTGKLIKASTATGISKLANGVQTTVAAPVGAIIGDTDSQRLSNKTVVNPIIEIPTGNQYRSSGMLYSHPVVLTINTVLGQYLWTYTLPANMLSKNGDALRATVYFITAGTSGTARGIRWYLDAAQLIEISTLATVQVHWHLVFTFIRMSSVSIRFLITMTLDVSPFGGANTNQFTCDFGISQDLKLYMFNNTTSGGNNISHIASYLEFLPLI